MIFSRFIPSHFHLHSVHVIDQCEVKMAGNWPFSHFFFVLWAAANSSAIRTRLISINLDLYLDLLAGQYNVY